MSRRRSRPQANRGSKHADLSATPAVKSEADLYALLGSSACPFLLVLDGVQDPHNLGACLRTADAAGADAVVAPRDRAAPMTATVRHIASGAAENMPFVRVTNLARTLEQLREEGLRVVGTADDAPHTIYEADLKGPLAVVLGSEGQGLRRLTRQRCDAVVRIPMAGTVECLNVSVASGVCLFEAARQRAKRA